MRVVLITGQLVRAGAEQQLVSLAAALRGAGHEVRVMSLREPEAYVDELAAIGVPVLRAAPVPPLRGLTAVVRARRALRRERPDVVVGFAYSANVVARLAGRLARVPVVVSTVRVADPGGRRRVRTLRLTDRFTTITTATSRRVADAVVARGVVRADRIVVVPAGVDVEAVAPRRSREAVRAELGVPQDAFAFACVGELERPKDHVTLLAALALLPEQDRVHLLIVGDGRERPTLERTVREIGMQDRVHLLGVRADVPDLLGASDALVRSARHGELPSPVMEAMAAGLPVVTTDVGAVAELVRNGVNGAVVPARSPMRLAAAMSELVRLPAAARRRMGEASRSLILDRYDLDDAMARWVDLLERTAGVERRRPLAGTSRTAAGARRVIDLTGTPRERPSVLARPAAERRTARHATAEPW